MSIKPANLTPELYQYVLTHSLRHEPNLDGLYQETIALPAGKMASSPEQIQLLAMLVKLMQAERLLELGTFTGYATLGLALATSQRGQVITCDLQHQFSQLGERYWKQAGVHHKITTVQMPALSYLDELLLEKQTAYFDFVYVDADKKNYALYFEKLLLLVRPGGLIVFDNVLWSGEVINPNNQEAATLAIRQFNQKIIQDERVEVSLIPLGDGMTLTRLIA